MSKSLPETRRLLAGLAFLFPLFAAPDSHAKRFPSKDDCFHWNRSEILFPDTRVGTRQTEEIRLINDCPSAITILSITGEPGVFATNEPMPLRIPSGHYWSVYMNFTPASPGLHQGTVTIRLKNHSPRKFLIPIQGNALPPPSLTLSHDSLEATVPAGSSAPLTLAVTNDRDERLEAVIDFTGPAQPRPAAGWRVLYLNTVIPGQDSDDFTRALSARPGVDTVIAFDGTAGAPTLAQLLGYDVVMVNGSSAWADREAVSNGLKDYLHAGGKVALLAGTMASAGDGRVQYPIDAYYTFYNAPSLATGGQSASFETHPINEGVGAFSSASVIPSSSIGGPGMGSPLGYYDNGYLLGAYHPQMPVVCLNIHPVDGGWSGELPAWVANAFDYLGGMANWTTYTKPWPNDFIFVVTERSTRNLELVVNTYRMAPGSYRGELLLYHSDPASPHPLTVPINLTVTP